MLPQPQLVSKILFWVQSIFPCHGHIYEQKHLGWVVRDLLLGSFCWRRLRLWGWNSNPKVVWSWGVPEWLIASGLSIRQRFTPLGKLHTAPWSLKWMCKFVCRICLHSLHVYEHVIPHLKVWVLCLHVLVIALLLLLGFLQVNPHSLPTIAT